VTTLVTTHTPVNPEKNEQANRNWLTRLALQPRPAGFEPATLGSEDSTRHHTQTLITIALLDIEDSSVLANRDISHRFMTSGKPIPSPSPHRNPVGLLLQHGESLHYVREQLGHASIQTMVDVYGHLAPGSNRNAVSKLDDDETNVQPPRPKFSLPGAPRRIQSL
jgi:hypothetical protein